MRILGAIVIFVALAGCAQQTPVVEPAETSTATVEPAEPVAQPAQVFGGDCSAIFSDAALSEALGQPLTQPWLGQEVPSWAVQPLSPESSLVEHAGGVHCGWGTPPTSPDSFDGWVLYVDAVPASAVSAPEDVECVASDMSATGCPIDVTANGIRLSGVVTSDIEGVDPLARVAAVEALFVASANAAEAPDAPAPPAGSWQTPSDCAAIAASVDWKAVGESGPITSDDTMGTDAYGSVVEDDLRGGRPLYTCWIGGETWQTAFSLLGGGAWARDAVLAQEGAEVVDVPGLDLVVTTPAQGGIIDIFDGVNWLQSPWGSAFDDVMPTLEVVVDALNAAKVP
jgi:hypothetical protein